MIQRIFILFFLAFPTQLYSHPGIGIVMDSKGNVFYTDLVHVWKIEPDGNHEILVRDVHTHLLYLDENDNPLKNKARVRKIGKEGSETIFMNRLD